MKITDILNNPTEDKARSVVKLVNQLIPILEEIGGEDEAVALNKEKLQACKKYLEQFATPEEVRQNDLIIGDEYNFEFPNGDKARVKFVEYMFGNHCVFKGLSGNHPKNDALEDNCFILPPFLVGATKMIKAI